MESIRNIPPTSPFRTDCLEGKVALVTGGGSGIGFEISRQLLMHGCALVVLAGRRESFLREAAQSLNKHGCGGHASYVVCDVRKPEQCQAAVDAVGDRLDILVNGAAGNFLATAEGLKPKGFQTVMEIDALGTFQMCHAAHHLLKKKRSSVGTVIINISATLQYGATWFQCHASAAKSAVDSLTRSLALEWGADGIRVCGIAPGPIANTPGTTKLAPGLSSKDVGEMVAESIPLGRMGRAEEIGMAAVYLSSDAAAYMTGDTMVVDGGQWMWKPQMIDRESVSSFSRSIEAKSRNQIPVRTVASKL